MDPIQENDKNRKNQHKLHPFLKATSWRCKNRHGKYRYKEMVLSTNPTSLNYQR
jgi:hypothetical protein